MKTRTYLFVVATVLLAQIGTVLSATMSELEPQLRQRLEALRQYGATDAVPFEERKKLEESVAATIWEIGRVLTQAPSKDWSEPSSERRELIARIGRLIAPYNAVLLDLGFRKDAESSDLASQSRTLLKYTVSDHLLSETLQQHFAGPPKQAGWATDLLIEHRLLNEADVQKLVQALSSEANPSRRISRALELSQLRRPEAVPILAEMLSVPFTMAGTGSNTGVGLTENEAMSKQRIAADAIAYLGPLAKPLLPLLRQRMAEIAALLPLPEKQRYVTRLQVAIDQIEGKRPLQVRTALNASGALLVAAPADAEPEPTPATPAPVKASSTPVLTSTPVASPAPATPVAQTPATQVEQRASVWPWVVGILALVVIVAVALKRRA